MVMELARPEDRSALMEIYDRCFPGEHEYGEFYFDRFWKPERTLVARIDGKTAAMLHLIRRNWCWMGMRSMPNIFMPSARFPNIAEGALWAA